MSGGIAFVYDGDASFAGRLNTELVGLEQPTDDDVAWLRDRIERHLAETGSAVAERILGSWDTEAGRFVKVMPRDYKRVLEAQAAAEAAGTDPVEAVMAAATA
jgi:glutamate synthase (NADPH/NADH) large chain